MQREQRIVIESASYGQHPDAGEVTQVKFKLVPPRIQTKQLPQVLEGVLILPGRIKVVIGEELDIKLSEVLA